MRDSTDFDEFYAATSRRVLGHLYAMTGDMAASEDAVAEAFSRAWSKWSRVRQYESPEAWVRMVATRTAISSWRKTRNRLLAHRRVAPPVADPAQLGPDHVALVAALRSIAPNQRRAIVLHYLVGLSVAETAYEMAVAEGTVKSWLSRGRNALSQHLSTESTEPSEVDSAGQH